MTDVAFSVDDRFLFSCGVDENILQWEIPEDVRKGFIDVRGFKSASTVHDGLKFEAKRGNNNTNCIQ